MGSSRWTGVFGVVSASAILLAGAAWGQPAQYTPQDVIKAFAAPGPAADGPAKGQGGCPQGTSMGDDGVCDPNVDARGFSLADPGSAAAHKSASPAARPVARRAVASRPAVRLASAAVSPGDLLINFRTGSSELTGQGRSNAKVFAAALNSAALSGARFEISGHTDSTGSASKNQTLSEERAQAVRAQLIADGVDGGRLVAKGYGSQQPVSGLSPRAGANRRVEARRTDINS
jgi:outer membrane protein OmpA-like peptidoglycan-associated protein